MVNKFHTRSIRMLDHRTGTEEKKNEPDSPQTTRVDQECCKNITSKKEVADRLSELPDDILISIISRLPFQETTATGILSTRWRHLHTRVLSLDFHFDYNKLKKGRISKFSDYISRINHAMDSYKGGDNMHVSNAFRVHMPCFGKKFDKWLEFALARKVEIIDIRIPCHYNFLRCDCSFSDSIIRTTPCKQSLLGVKELHLSIINLKDQDIELILSKFVLLEHLSIYSPEFGRFGLVNVRVVGHCKLTHLNILDVSSLKSIEVRDMINLVSLRLYGRFPLMDVDLVLENVPNLVHFSNDDGRYKLFYNIFSRMSCIHHQLLHLKFSIYPDTIEREGLTFAKLINVKHLELNIIMPDRYGGHLLFPLIEECPSLEKLEIEFSWPSHDDMYIERNLYENRFKKKIKKIYNLKKVRLSGYFGSESELEFAMYLINNAVALQELIVEACDVTPEIRQEAIAHAIRHLQSVPLNSVNVVII